MLLGGGLRSPSAFLVTKSKHMPVVYIIHTFEHLMFLSTGPSIDAFLTSIS